MAPRLSTPAFDWLTCMRNGSHTQDAVAIVCVCGTVRVNQRNAMEAQLLSQRSAVSRQLCERQCH